MRNKGKYYREQFKTRKVFKEEKEYIQNDSHRGVNFVGNEVKRFYKFERGIRILGYVSLLIFVVLVGYCLYTVFWNYELSF